MRGLLDSFSEKQDFTHDEKLRVRKIFQVIIGVQPCVMSSEPYITGFMYPNVDEVLRTENFQISRKSGQRSEESEDDEVKSEKKSILVNILRSKPAGVAASIVVRSHQQ